MKYTPCNNTIRVLWQSGKTILISATSPSFLSKRLRWSCCTGSRTESFVFNGPQFSSTVHCKTIQWLPPSCWRACQLYYGSFRIFALKSNKHALIGLFSGSGSIVLSAWNHGMSRLVSPHIRRVCSAELRELLITKLVIYPETGSVFPKATVTYVFHLPDPAAQFWQLVGALSYGLFFSGLLTLNMKAVTFQTTN